MKYLLLLLLSFNANAVVLNGSLASGASIAVDFNSSALALDSFTGASITANINSSATIVGVIKLQASNDNIYPSGITKWVDVGSSSSAITADGNVLWNISPAFYKWIRVAWINTSGTALIDINYNVKSNNAGEGK